MAVFERYVPWMMYAGDRDICEFYFTVPNRPGQLRRALEVFARYGINILSMSAYSLPDWERAPVFLFADTTGINVDAERVRRELEIATGGKFLAEYLSEKLGLRGKELLVEVLKAYQASGWGRVELVRCDLHAANIVLRLYDSFECKVFRDIGRPASQFIRGHLSGLLSGLLGAEVRAIETKCIAKGDPYCEFYTERV